jgi:hypothetical protein
MHRGKTIWTISFIINLSFSLFSQDFDFPILVSDGINSLTLTVGVDPNGSIGFDPGLDILAPPPAPTGLFDARLRISNEDYYKDIRNNAITENEFLLLYSPETGGAITLSWNSSIVDSLGSFQMVDLLDGTYFNLNMSTADSLDIANYPILSSGLKILITPNPAVGIFPNSNDSNTFPDNWQLNQNYPNPFNPETRIDFGVPERGTLVRVRIEVYNIIGEKVKTLVDGNYEAGFHHTVWDGSDDHDQQLPSGVYFLHFKSKFFINTRKMLLIR